MPTPEVSLLPPLPDPPEPPEPPLPLPLEELGSATAEPSDFALASVFAELFSASAPPATTFAPLSTYARDVVIAIVTATAAATDTGPDEVFPDVVPSLPEPSAPAPEASSFAWLRSPPTCWSSVGDEPPPLLLLSPGVPFAEAEPLLVLDELPAARKDTAPAAVTSRDVPDSTSWCEIVRPSATPTAASLPSASPEAVDDADAVMCACASSLPVRLSAVPAPSVADTVTFEIVIATAGVTPTVPPFAPV